MSRFANRTAAGRELASRLKTFRSRNDVVVLGLPRGGVPVAFEVARSLSAPLDVMIVRKLGAPGHPELAIGAIASGGVTVWNEHLTALVSQEALRSIEAREQAELTRRERLYRAGRPAWSLRKRIVILVDDGAATGASMLAAVRALRQLEADRIVVALPVASSEACAILAREADELVCLEQPSLFYSVGEWYADFSQTTDEEVTDLLERAAAEMSRQSDG
ncbi:MAG: phosphoribosyltransferase [Xanthomonadaceae bacterium]|nr:phosphoribosyltransferase [Xanthomonadaceae bacterium]